MKHFRTLFLSVLVLTISSSCNKQLETNTISGQWHLVEYSASSSQIMAKTFNHGEVIWTFDQDNLSVSISVENNSNFDLFASGEYDYNQGEGLNASHGDDVFIGDLHVDDRSLGYTEIRGNDMTISKEATSGHRLTFVRL